MTKNELESPQGCAPEALVEKVAREMWDAVDADPQDFWDVDFNAYDCMARAAIAVLRPIIRAEALDEAAKVCDDISKDVWTQVGGSDLRDWMEATAKDCADAIRALREKQ